MAYDYNKSKQMYQSMTKEQQQQFVNQNKNDANFKQFMSDYMNDINGKNQTNTQSNFNNGQKNLPEMPTEMAVPSGEEQRPLNQTNTQSNNQPYDISKAQDTRTQDYTQRQPENLDMTMDEYRKQNNQVSPDLDQSKFNQAPGQITVKEGTAQQTGKPDYQISTDARLNEMKSNLDQYFATSPRMFSDRQTFNKVFEYNNRESEAQRQLLDSYRKRKEDMDKASQYTSGEAINNGLKNAEITTDQLNLIKEYDPEAYKQWQELQEEQIKLRIVNDIVPPLMEDIASQINDMINRLGIQAQEALDIEGIYNDTMDRLGAYQTLEDANRTVKQIEEITNKKTAIMNRYAASTGGTVSDALAAARMAKAIAPYNEQLQGLQYQYQDYYNLYSQKTATATQAANVRALQAQENQRIWNQKCSALGFAMDAMSYRTPEQEAQLALQKQQALNDMNLLYQSQLNDLNRYNAYATAKLDNQLQQELTDLSVEDETQLKANLNNALSDYYDNYGDIIQRSQSQAVEDIIDYAKKKGISVAQALTENFIKPLQNKAEYKQKVATDYGMLSKQSIATINGRSVIMTTNPNGSISYRYIDDPYATGEDGEYVQGTAKPYNQIDSRAFNNNPVDTGYTGKTLYNFLQGKKTNETQRGGQCGKFVNDYLQYIGVTDANNRYYDNDLSTKLNSINLDYAKEGAIAVFDYGHKSSDGINHGHVGIVTKVYNDGSFDVVDSNYDVNKPETIGTRRIYPGTNSLKGFFDPSQPPSATSIDNVGLSAVDEAKKQTYLEEAKRGKLGVNDIKDIGDLAAEQGWGDEWQEALKGGQEWEYSDTQLKRMDQYYKDFIGNTDVQNFDKAKNQFRQLVVALNDESGVGDMSAIYTFMKTLDPTSVVREGEFAAAQNTIGDANWDAILLKLEKHIDGKRLSKKQREQFKEVAKEFIRIQAESYQQQYDFMINRYKGTGIKEVDFPPNTAQILLDELGYGEATGPDNQLSDIYGAYQNYSPYGNITYGGYSADTVSSLVNG